MDNKEKHITPEPTHAELVTTIIELTKARKKIEAEINDLKQKIEDKKSEHEKR